MYSRDTGRGNSREGGGGFTSDQPQPPAAPPASKSRTRLPPRVAKARPSRNSACVAPRALRPAQSAGESRHCEQRLSSHVRTKRAAWTCTRSCPLREAADDAPECRRRNRAVWVCCPPLRSGSSGGAHRGGSPQRPPRWRTRSSPSGETASLRGRATAEGARHGAGVAGMKPAPDRKGVSVRPRLAQGPAAPLIFLKLCELAVLDFCGGQCTKPSLLRSIPTGCPSASQARARVFGAVVSGHGLHRKGHTPCGGGQTLLPRGTKWAAVRFPRAAEGRKGGASRRAPR